MDDEDETKPTDLLAHYALVMARRIAEMNLGEAVAAFGMDAPEMMTAARRTIEWRERHPFGTV